MNSGERRMFLVGRIMAEMPAMSMPEFICTMLLAEVTVGSGRQRAWLTYADFKERTMLGGSTAIANALKAVVARGFFRRCEGEGSNWEIGVRIAALEGQDAPPTGQDSPPAGQDTPPAGQDTPPAGQDTPPAGQGTLPAGEDAPPAGEVALMEPDAGTAVEPAERQDGTAGVPLPLDKERTNYGDDREWGRNKTRARAGDPVQGCLGAEAEGIPRPRTAEETELVGHPAAQAWLRAGMGWPGWARLRMITARLGREPQVERLRQAWEMWLMAGYRAGNVGGILDWYEALGRDPTWRPFLRTGGYVGAQVGAPQAVTQAGAQAGRVNPTTAMLLRMIEEEKNGKRSNGSGLFGFAELGLSKNAVQRGFGGGLPAGAG